MNQCVRTLPCNVDEGRWSKARECKHTIIYTAGNSWVMASCRYICTILIFFPLYFGKDSSLIRQLLKFCQPKAWRGVERISISKTTTWTRTSPTTHQYANSGWLRTNRYTEQSQNYHRTQILGPNGISYIVFMKCADLLVLYMAPIYRAMFTLEYSANLASTWIVEETSSRHSES